MRVFFARLALAATLTLAIAGRSFAAPIAFVPCTTAPCTASYLVTSLGDGASTSNELSGNSLQDLVVFDSAAISDFNRNGLLLGVTRGISGQSQWLDSFTITGGSGAGVMTVDWSLDGTLTATPFSFGCSGFAGVGLTSIGGFGSATLSHDTLDTCTTQTVNQSGSFDVPFTYGSMFTGGLNLFGNTDAGGSLDFSHTALITDLILPPGAILQTGSQTAYPTATPVPEPSSVLLLAIGLVGGIVCKLYAATFAR